MYELNSGSQEDLSAQHDTSSLRCCGHSLSLSSARLPEAVFDALENSQPADWRDQLVSTRDALMGSARARLRNEDLAADVVASVMLAALEQPPEFDEPARIKAWLFGILRHKLVDVLRQRTPQRVRHIGLDPCTPESGAPLDALAGTDPGPERRLVGHRFLEDLNAALARLPLMHSQAFLLSEVLGEATETTCCVLGISPNYLGVCLHRARARLRHLLVAHAA